MSGRGGERGGRGSGRVGRSIVVEKKPEPPLKLEPEPGVPPPLADAKTDAKTCAKYATALAIRSVGRGF